MQQKLPQQRALGASIHLERDGALEAMKQPASQDSNDEISVIAEIAELFF
jgi:hypothetical protein